MIYGDGDGDNMIQLWWWFQYNDIILGMIIWMVNMMFFFLDMDDGD